jgi:hypothetical protein
MLLLRGVLVLEDLVKQVVELNLRGGVRVNLHLFLLVIPRSILLHQELSLALALGILYFLNQRSFQVVKHRLGLLSLKSV